MVRITCNNCGFSFDVNESLKQVQCTNCGMVFNVYKQPNQMQGNFGKPQYRYNNVNMDNNRGGFNKKKDKFENNKDSSRKKLLIIVAIIAVMFCFMAVSGTKTTTKTGSFAGLAFTESEFEQKLDNGVNMVGSLVTFKASKVAPKSAYGYNIQAGKHLNFTSESTPPVLR